MRTGYFTDYNTSTESREDDYGSPLTRYRILRWSEEVLRTYGYACIEVSQRGLPLKNGYFNQHYNSGGVSELGYRESTIYSFVDTYEQKLIGFFGISCSDLHIPLAGSNKYMGKVVKYVMGRDGGEDFIRGRKAFGAISLDYFALCKDYQGKVIGYYPDTNEPIKFSEYMMHECINMCKIASSYIGADCVMLHSTDAGLKTYYQFGFDFMYEKDYRSFIRKYPEFKSRPKQCVNTEFTYITSRSYSEGNCFPMVFRI